MNRSTTFILIGAGIGSIFVAANRIRVLNQLNKVYNTYKGIVYCWGGTKPTTGFDCSGFAYYVYNNYLNKPTTRTTAAAMAANSRPVLIPKPGDLIYFKDTNGNINHVGIYIDNKTMLHSGGNSGVSYADYTKPYWIPKFAFIGRLN